MGAKKLLTENQERTLYKEYHLFINDIIITKVHPRLCNFFNLLRTKDVSFAPFTDRELSNKIIALRRVEGVIEWPNVSQLSKYISPEVRNLVQKARNSALIAVEIYNKPTVSYRSETFIVMMMIAWTSLFHSIFKKAGKRIQYSESDEGYFDLRKCLNIYDGILKREIIANLTILIDVRDQIVHRDNPVLDERLFPNCQACLLNFEEVIVNHFGPDYKLNYSLAYSLQFSNNYTEEQLVAIKNYKNRHYYNVIDFMEQYEKILIKDYPEVYSSPNYAFRVYLIPKIAKQNQSDAAIEYINYDSKNIEDYRALEKTLIMFKESRTTKGNYFKAGEVSDLVYDKLKSKMVKGWKFNASYHHSKCAEYFKIRQGHKTKNPEQTKKEFCQYEPVFEQYIYTQQWIDFLVKQLSDKGTYEKIFKSARKMAC